MSSNQPFGPLSPAILHILVALASEDRHGYGIMQAVMKESGGHYKLGPGTLYDNLEKLLSAGFVEEAPQAATNDDPRRRYYRISRTGRELLSAEFARLEDLARHAKPWLRPQPESL